MMSILIRLFGMNLVRYLCIVGTVITLSVTTGAQTPPAQEPVSAQSENNEQSPTFRSGVTLVTTDVIIRDSNGQFIPDLETEDLLVYEDGQPQDIASLVLVHGGRVYNQLLPPPPVQEGIILPPARPVADSAGRIFIFFVDDLHLERGLTLQVRKVFKKIADTLVHEGDMFGIVSTGTSGLAIDMTYDRSLLYSAMERITGDGLNAQEFIEELNGGTNGPLELRWRVHKAFKLAREIIGNLERVENRRKAFIYLSSGYDFNPFHMQRLRESSTGAALRSLEEFDNTSYYRGIPEYRLEQLAGMIQPGSVFADTDLAAELADLARSANRANASFYTIDPRGLQAVSDIEYDVPLMEWHRHLQQTQVTMRMLAELTGGIAVVNTNNFDDALQKIDAETSDYYVLGFYSNNPDPTYRTRELKVEVNRADVEVRHRTHYTFARELNNTVLDSAQ